jgi:hypothetical protein
MNLRPLGYEHYDGRLRRLPQSPAPVMTSANAKRAIHRISQRLSHPIWSQDASCTSTCTEPVPGLHMPHVAIIAAEAQRSPPPRRA